MTVADLGLVESNGTFAAPALAVTEILCLAAENVNPNGVAIAHGHPVGATGSIITLNALYELEWIAGRYVLITMCIGGGKGVALILECLPS
ncbi:MAG: hypothetical protein OIF57_05325 [Marinobacterium sp.]|nr:hypothetical protein [Marinobacterium sp.]